MELKENNFNEYFKEVYKPVTEPFTEALDYINNIHKAANIEELENLTPYCYNALTQTIEFCKYNNITYYGSFLERPERLIMLATETYMFDTYCLALEILIEYTKEINAAKSILKHNPRINLLVNSNIMENTKLANLIMENTNSKGIITSYNSIYEIISNYNVKEDISYAFEYFLPIFIESLNDMRITYNMDESNEITTSQLYSLLMSGLFNKLNTLNDNDLMIQISKANTKAVSEYNEYVKKLKR